MKEITSSTFESETKSGVTVIDFWAEWCQPCRMYGPLFERVSKKFVDRANFVKCDSEANFELSAKFVISALPTTLILKDGQVVEKVEGLIAESKLVDLVEKALK